MYLLCTTSLLTSHKNQPLSLALTGWLKKKNRPNQIGKKDGHNKQISGELRITFSYNLLKFTNSSFFSSNGMYFLCITNLIITYQNQPLLLALGGKLEKKNSSNQISI